MNQNNDLDHTLNALQGDLKSIPTHEALAIIDSWSLLFKDTALGEDLQRVREAIEHGDGTSIALSNILLDLGANTFESSNEAVDDETTAAKIQDIGTLLIEAGNLLKKS
jgi:hypothetical protein